MPLREAWLNPTIHFRTSRSRKATKPGSSASWRRATGRPGSSTSPGSSKFQPRRRTGSSGRSSKAGGTYNDLCSTSLKFNKEMRWERNSDFLFDRKYHVSWFSVQRLLPTSLNNSWKWSIAVRIDLLWDLAFQSLRGNRKPVSLLFSSQAFVSLPYFLSLNGAVSSPGGITGPGC